MTGPMPQNGARKPVARRSQRNWDEATKQRALDLYKSSGVTEASKATGVPRQSITSWAKQAGVLAGYTAGQAARVEILKMRAGDRQDLAVEQWSKVVELGTARVIEALENGRMSPRDAAWAAAVAFDKVRLAQGDPTRRADLSVNVSLAAHIEAFRAMTGLNDSELINVPVDQQIELPVTNDAVTASALVIDAEVVENE